VLAAAVTVAAGLATRVPPLAGLPWRDAVGDALYTVLVYCLMVFAVPSVRPVAAAAAAGAFSFAVEFGQLTALPATAARHFPAARLVLGTAFSAADLAWYAAGAVLAAATHHGLSRLATDSGAPGTGTGQVR
jgi:hypothetical protein